MHEAFPPILKDVAMVRLQCALRKGTELELAKIIVSESGSDTSMDLASVQRFLVASILCLCPPEVVRCGKIKYVNNGTAVE